MEVYRTKPKPGKYYETVEYTRKEGKWPDEKYYTIIKPLYVGKFLNETISGYSDNKIVCYHFENDIKKCRSDVYLNYEGTTSFLEVNCRSLETKQRILALSKMMITKTLPTSELIDQSNILEKINNYYIKYL
jgi:hypothetical protein